ncbi:MAG: DUF4358 domain-containing protein [Oscillospiraceae bacterium]|nr:DUF4358 domain-containing protein [Oscillospiraceae bacterium]
MKKSTLFIAAALSCVMLAGCGDNQSSNSGSNPASWNGSTASKPESTDSENSWEVVSNSDISSNVIFYDISSQTDQLMNDVEFPSMVAVKEDNLEVYYGFTMNDVAEYSAYICGSGAMPDEFGIFVAQSEDAASRIKECLENRVEAQKKTYEDYPIAANELYKLDDAFVNINGTTVTYAICADNNIAKDILG